MRQLRYAALCGLLLTSAGCMQVMVSAPAPEIAGSPHEVRADSYAGSLAQRPGFILADQCHGREQLARVLVRRSFWQGFVGWISLGLITPATVVYECSNAAGQAELGNSSDGGR
ncbi:MAG TPA: hypothetical protein VGW40_14680 [Allosphingosinicella sp.]|nr:hypothetical protein [Allosphingosinicella sp.]